MKNLVVISILSLMLCGCGEDAPPSKSGSTYIPPAFSKESAVGSTNQPAATATKNTASSSAGNKNSDSKGMGFVEGAAAVIDYGTGSTPLTIKKKQEQKIQQLQDQHNKAMNRAIQQ